MSNFDGVIHLNGSTYLTNFSPSAQILLSDYVEDGHFWIGSQWTGYERVNGRTSGMNDLVLQLWNTPGSNNCGNCTITYSTEVGQSGHPVLAGIPASFTFAADGHSAGQ